MRRVDGFVILLSLYFYDLKIYEPDAVRLIYLRLILLEQANGLLFI
jgi:hypothetical protein